MGYYIKRTLFFMGVDFFLFYVSFIVAVFLRYGFIFPYQYEDSFITVVPAFILLRLAILHFSRAYKPSWRFYSMHEAFYFMLLLLLTSIIFFICNIVLIKNAYPFALPRSVVIIELVLSCMSSGFFRFSKRIFYEVIVPCSKEAQSTAIIGAGQLGEMVVRDLRKSSTTHKPVIFVDDNATKKGMRIHGVPVVGSLDDLEKVVPANNISAAIIAIQNLEHLKTRKIFEILRSVGLENIMIVPNLYSMVGEINLAKNIRELKLEDFLPRDPFKIEKEIIHDSFEGKTILITGGAGSIGSEVTRQALKFTPKRLVILDVDETELHDLMLRLKTLKPDTSIELIPVVCDIRDDLKLSSVFDEHDIDIVFHAAAYKHVPLMESFPEEAIKVNIGGTYNLASLSAQNNIDKFVNISTDKAVHPTSVMGATKRIAEIICSSFSKDSGVPFISVRFGNVLGSRGSVIPIFLDQIKNGGPITITHPEMVRFFMTIPEAVLLVFQAGIIGEGGNVMVLDMGKPVKIINLAEDLIELHGMTPGVDIEIVYSGIRPGEKLYEELLTAEEGVEKTYHERVFCARYTEIFSIHQINELKDNFLTLASQRDVVGIKDFIKKYVPTYQGQ